MDGRRGAGEIERDAAAFDLGAAGEAKRVVDALDVEGALVDAVGEVRDAVPDGPLALAADGGGERREVVQSVLVHELQELARSDLVAGHVGHEVAEDLLGDPDIGADEVERRLVEPARVRELADGEAQSLVVDLGRGGAEPEAADVGQVGDAHRVAGDPAVAEHRAHHVDVEEVPRAHPCVVGGNDVTRLEGVRRELREHVTQGRGRGAGERRHAVAPLGHRVPFRVEDHHRQVPALAHDGREGASDEGGDDLVGDPDEPVPHDGQAHRVDGGGAHESLSSFASSATRLRCASTVARSPGPITQVDSRSSMTAGPSMVAPGPSA